MEQVSGFEHLLTLSSLLVVFRAPTTTQAYIPSHLEWINDSSCNVVWPDGDSHSVKRVLWALGKELKASHFIALSPA
jgi:hypothetical protein